jgi:hypothetical protein
MKLRQAEFSRGYECEKTKNVLTYFSLLNEENCLDFNPPYQRDYEWGYAEQQNLLLSLVMGDDIGRVALTISPDDNDKFIVVDGKQRLMTILLFLAGKLPFLHRGKAHYFPHDFDLDFARALKKRSLFVTLLRYHDGSGLSLKDQVDFFLRVNYSGKPLSVDHQTKVLALLH